MAIIGPSGTQRCAGKGELNMSRSVSELTVYEGNGCGAGAGKSTLLDALAMRSCGVRTGDVLVNGDAVLDAMIVAESTYISQVRLSVPVLSNQQKLHIRHSTGRVSCRRTTSYHL